MRKPLLFLALMISVAAPATSSAAVRSLARASGFAPGIGMTSLTFHSVSCVSITNCTAVGWSDDAQGDQVGIRAIIGPYGGWEQNTVPFSGSDELNSVSCLASGGCGFVGVETNSSSDLYGGKPFQSGLLGDVTSTLETIMLMTLPGNADLGRPAATKVTLDSISCPSSGSCVAVGSYSTSAGVVEPLSVTQAVQLGTSWAQPSTEISLPPDADMGTQSADLHSVACSGAGSCQAVGWYTDASGATEPMVATLTDGTWTQPTAISVPGNATAQLQSIFCTSAGSCQAVGEYSNGSGANRPMVATERSGTWGAATQLPLPYDAGTDSSGARMTNLDSLSCTTPADCQAVGGYVDTSGNQEPLAETETNGIWALTAGGIAAPANANQAAATQTANLNGVECFPLTKCLAVGDYVTASGTAQAMHVTFAPEQTGIAVIQAVKTSGARLTVTLRCKGHPGAVCVGTLTLGAVEHLSGRRVTAITATARKRTRLLSFDSSRYGLSSGAHDPIMLKLSVTGRQLLARYGRLHAALAAAADGAVAKTVTKAIVFRAS